MRLRKTDLVILAIWVPVSVAWSWAWGGWMPGVMFFVGGIIGNLWAKWREERARQAEITRWFLQVTDSEFLAERARKEPSEQ